MTEAYPNLPIQQAINSSYLNCVQKAAFLQRYVQEKKGPLPMVFTDFYEAFYLIFILTTKLKELREEKFKLVIEKVEKWFEPNQPDMERAMRGLVLFNDYQDALFATNILTK